MSAAIESVFTRFKDLINIIIYFKKLKLDQLFHD